MPFTYDEREKIYKEVQATQIFTSPVKQSKEFDQDDVDEDVSEIIVFLFSFYFTS